MKQVILSAMLAGTIGLMAFQKAAEPLPIGAAIPKMDVKLKDVSGKMISFKDALKGNGLLVMFSCNTCPYVIRNQDRTQEAGKYAAAKNLGFVVVNSNENLREGEDSFEAMQKYAKEQGYTWNYVLDPNSEMADAFGATRTPECFLFNKEGKLVYHGAIDDNPNDAGSVSRKHLKEAIDEMLSGKEVTTKLTRSVGCTIKRKA